MTREKAINTIHELMKACVPNSNYYIVGEMAIKALEQEPILDKVRAEIKAMSGDIETIADVLAILDKYKVESEDKE